MCHVYRYRHRPTIVLSRYTDTAVFKNADSDNDIGIRNTEKTKYPQINTDDTEMSVLFLYK